MEVAALELVAPLLLVDSVVQLLHTSLEESPVTELILYRADGIFVGVLSQLTFVQLKETAQFRNGIELFHIAVEDILHLQ